MKNAKHDEAPTVKNVAKDISRLRHIKHKLAIFRTALNGATDKRMLGEYLRFAPDFCADDRRKARMAILKKSGEAIEIGQRGCRPLKLH